MGSETLQNERVSGSSGGSGGVGEAAWRVREAADHFLLHAVRQARFPAASYVIGTRDEIVAANAFGAAVVEPESICATKATIFDFASITKPLVTATIALLLEQEGRVDLDEPVAKWLPELRGDKAHISFVDLLSHRSGLPTWWPFYAFGRGEESYLRQLVDLPLEYQTGTRVIYSCPGYILATQALQRVIGEPLGVHAHRTLLANTRAVFKPAPELRPRIAATDRGNVTERGMVRDLGIAFDGFREGIIWGEVNDGNSWGIGGFAGNAGLFGTAEDAWLLATHHLGGGLLDERALQRARKNYTAGLDENRGIGWQLRSDSETSPSSVLSPSAVGHTGFTGTSVWIDPDRDLIIVLLTNRVHPEIREANMQTVRRAFHEKIVKAWDSP